MIVFRRKEEEKKEEVFGSVENTKNKGHQRLVFVRFRLSFSSLFVLCVVVSSVLISALDASKPYRGQYAGSRCCICVPNAICITVVVYRSDQSPMDRDDDDRFR